MPRPRGAFPVPDIRLTVDRQPHVAPAGATAGAVLRELGIPAVVVRMTTEDQAGDDVDVLRDLSYVPEDGDVLESVPADTEEGRAVLRHSTAHVMAQAVQDLFPEARLGIGPPVENGFYYDFEVPRPFTLDDLTRIEARMREIVAAGQRFSRRVVSEEEARAELAGEPYKLELITLKGSTSGDEAVETGGPELSMYDNLAHGAHGERVWTDLCRGPHLPATGDIPAFKLMRTAAAYWRGDEHNPQLQRVYGTAWESQEALERYLTFLEEAERRDHRRLGVELDLFSFPPEVGSGLAVWHPKGGAVRKVMEDYSRLRHEQAGYEFVNTPHLAKAVLFETSGHLQWYAENMYPPMAMEGSTYYLKPMSCPFHILVYQARGRSYRELPLRLFEFGTVYRFEKSGVVHGLTRVRGLTQDDAHIFVTPEELTAELTGLLDFVISLLRDFGLTEFEAELATRPDKYVGQPEQWDEATAALREALETVGVAYVVAEGEGSFYAPKIDMHARDAIGRRWQLSTIQVDLQLPARFNLEYQATDGSRPRPHMIHRALFGSIERFFGILLEHYAGALPAWLAPVQVTCIPIAERHLPYLHDVAARLREVGVRVEVDESDDRMQKKIVKAQHGKVPYMLIAGDRDVAAGAVSFRYRSGEEQRGVPVDQALDEVVTAIAERRT